MLALIEGQDAPRGGVREIRLGGARFLALAVRQGDGVRAALSQRRAVRVLRRSGVTRAVFPRGFAHTERFASWGILPVEVMPLREALAADIALCALRERGIAPERATVALCCTAVTRAVADTAEMLARSVRYLLLRTERGGWELAYALRRTLGVAVTVEPLRGETAADIALCFDADAAVRGSCLPLFDPALCVDYAAPVLADCPEAEPEQLLAALCAVGALRRDALTVTRVGNLREKKGCARTGARFDAKNP